jgi:hypothetical protein
MLRRETREPTALSLGHVRIGTPQVAEGNPAAAGHGRIDDVTDPPAEPEGERQRHATGGGGQAAGGYAERRRRSLYSSTAIGISESTITITTTTWMCSPMFGTVCPRR